MPPTPIGFAPVRPLVIALALCLGGADFARAAEAPPPATPDADVEAALALAKDHRPALERALAAAAQDPDPYVSAGVRFLIANMPDKGYVITALKDAKGASIPFDPLAAPDFAAAQKALDEIEKAHGTVDFSRDHVVLDLETIPGDGLLHHVHEALLAWRGSPAAGRVDPDAFFAYVLPYRGSEEPFEVWMPAVRARYASPPTELGEAPDAAATWRWVSADVARRVRFDERYYLHPTDQGFSEMEKSGMGRCEDITNAMTYAARSRGLATAADYTPAWAHRDNNHAWNVLLDAHGRGSEPSNAHAAKVYRKTFALQRASLAFRLPAGREAPNRFLASKAYVDVTDQYAETTDVTVSVDDAAARGEAFAYLCVFNGGEWTAIHWAPLVDGKATFARMGRGSHGLAYLPAVHDGKALIPVGPPLLLGKDGIVTPLPGTSPAGVAVLVATTPEQVSVDTHAVTPVSRLTPGATYVLSRWDTASRGWKDVAERVVEAAAWTEPLSPDGLYWLVEKAGRKLERIFTVGADGRQRFW